MSTAVDPAGGTHKMIMTSVVVFYLGKAHDTVDVCSADINLFRRRYYFCTFALTIGYIALNFIQLFLPENEKKLPRSIST